MGINNIIDKLNNELEKLNNIKKNESINTNTFFTDNEHFNDDFLFDDTNTFENEDISSEQDISCSSNNIIQTPKYEDIEPDNETVSLVTIKENRLLVAQNMFKKSIRISLKSFLISITLSFLNLFI